VLVASALILGYDAAALSNCSTFSIITPHCTIAICRSSMVYQCVCWSRSFADWTDRDAGWSTDSHGPKELYITWGLDRPKEKGQFLGLPGPLKRTKSLLMSTQGKISNSISVTAAADCIAPNWRGSH